jgi:hypothetical protein
MYWRILGVVAIVCLLVVALLYAVRAVAPSAASVGSTACEAPVRLTAVAGHSDVTGARIGPLLFNGFSPGPDATIADWQPGTIQKVLIRHVESSGELRVSGARCSDGKPLRLWYRVGAAPFTSRDASSTPFPTSVLESTGDEVVTFAPADVGAVLPDHMGYMFFTSAGLWRIDVAGSNGRIASGTFQVGPQP